MELRYNAKIMIRKEEGDTSHDVCQQTYNQQVAKANYIYHGAIEKMEWFAKYGHRKSQSSSIKCNTI